MLNVFFKGQKIFAAEINANFDSVETAIDSFDSVDPVPSGIICLWSDANVPDGWLVCDGSNGTPDLRDRFVVGVSENFDLNSTGGLNEVSLSSGELPEHSHDAGTFSAAEAGGHGHAYWGGPTSSNNSPTISGRYWNATNSSLTSSSSGEHAHNISNSSASTGGNEPHENRPPYYALFYIIKE